MAGAINAMTDQPTQLAKRQALQAVLADLLDVLKGLPSNDAKRDGLTYAVGNVNKHLSRLEKEQP